MMAENKQASSGHCRHTDYQRESFGHRHQKGYAKPERAKIQAETKTDSSDIGQCQGVIQRVYQYFEGRAGEDDETGMKVQEALLVKDAGDEYSLGQISRIMI